MNIKYFFSVTFLFFFSTFLYSQKGKNGAGNITAANTKVNEFTALTTNAGLGATVINVASSSLNLNSRFTSSLAPGDLIMIIQMQGALIKLIPVPIWAPDSTYGNIYSYETCGNYEFAEVKSVISATQIELNCGLSLPYRAAGKTQIVRMPRYNSLTISSTGILTTDAWNGTIGGVLAAEVSGNTVINAGGSLSATGLGFRGGVAIGNSGSANGNFVTKNPNDGAEKGEGIGSDRLINSAATNDTLGKQCKGAPANGGGGGNANNCGGGGGGNGGNTVIYYGLGVLNTTYSTAFNLEFAGRALVVSSGGGKGGYGTSTVNGNPNTNAPNNPFWGGFERPKYGGFGGRPLDYSTGKIYLGGGGGAGHKSASQSNGLNSGTGGNGGGIICLLNYGTISGAGNIVSNGANGINSFGNPTLGNPTQGIDGAGGAGAGGTIILKSNGLISGIIATANGGTGGNQVISGTPTNEGQGPGGGGGGGYIAANGSVFTQNVNGGTNGITNAIAFATAFPMNGATSGNIGSSNQIVPVYSLTPSSITQTLCANQSTTISATTNNPSATIQWFTSLTGGTSVATGTLYTTPVYSLPGTYTVFAGSCPGIYRQPISITVNASLNISVNSPTICSGQTALLTANGAATYSWVAGPNTFTNSVSPSSTTVYTINGTSGTCTGSQTATVTVGSNFVITVTPPTTVVCAGQSALLTASGANTYTWSTGVQTTSINVNPPSTTIYSVIGSIGTCTGTGTSTLTIDSGPTLTLSASPANICTGQSTTLQALGANTYTWSNSVNGSSQTVSPATLTTYSVSGTNSNGCTNTIPFTITINVTATPTVSANSATICTGSTATLSAQGATSYTWSTSENTSVINPSPTATTAYTVSGSNGGCAEDFVTFVNVSSPDLSLQSATSGCVPLYSCIRFTNNSISTNTTIVYSFGDGITGTSNNPTHCYSNSGTYTITATLTDANTGCIVSYTLPTPIAIYEQSTALFTIAEGTIIAVGSEIHIINNSANNTNTAWFFCENITPLSPNYSSLMNITASVTDTGFCCIALIAHNPGCRSSMTQCIKIIDETIISIPNVFTPNNDTKNDLFKIKSSGVKSLSCAIFDRWGLKLYEWDGINGYWDGKTKSGTLASDGSYFYIIIYTDFKDVSKTEKGFLSLFRD